MLAAVASKILSEDAHVAAIGSKGHVESIADQWHRPVDPLEHDISQ